MSARNGSVERVKANLIGLWAPNSWARFAVFGLSFALANEYAKLLPRPWYAFTMVIVIIVLHPLITGVRRTKENLQGFWKMEPGVKLAYATSMLIAVAMIYCLFQFPKAWALGFALMFILLLILHRFNKPSRYWIPEKRKRARLS